MIDLSRLISTVPLATWNVIKRATCERRLQVDVEMMVARNIAVKMAAIWLEPPPMCNLYNVRSNREAVLDLSRSMVGWIGWNEPSRDIYPGTLAPIVRVGTNGEREMVMATWGMPPPERPE